MKVEHLVYDDNVIAVALVSTSEKKDSMSLALRWLEPGEYLGRDGGIAKLSNPIGGRTDWFIVPFTFGAAVVRTLVAQRAAGLSGFQDDGFNAMVAWLVEFEELQDAMCYSRWSKLTFGRVAACSALGGS